MRRSIGFAAMASVLATSACTIPQGNGPNVTAMPGDGKSFEAFQGDDQRCRQAAAQANGFVTPKQAAERDGNAAVLFGLGAGTGAGAMIGSSMAAVGAGAILGAGAGLAAGGLLAAGVAQQSAQNNQHHYDVTYVQCMAAAGERVPDLASNGSPGAMTGTAPVPVSAAPLPSQGYAQPQAAAAPYEPPAAYQQETPPAYQPRPVYYAQSAYPPLPPLPQFRPRPVYAAYYDAPPPPPRAYGGRCQPGYCARPPMYAPRGYRAPGWDQPDW